MKVLILRRNHVPGVDVYSRGSIPVVVFVEEKEKGMLILTVEEFLIVHIVIMPLHEQEILDDGDADYLLPVGVAHHLQVALHFVDKA